MMERTDDDALDARPTQVTYLIVGAGAAGLQLAYLMERMGGDYLVVEAAASVGQFWRQFPRSRSLISFNKVQSIYTDPELQLRYDWNSLLTDDYAMPFREYSGRLFPRAHQMVRYLRDFAHRYGLRVRYRARVSTISRGPDGGFLVKLRGGATVACRYVIVATGMHKPFVPAIPGIELADGYESAPFDPEAYRDQRVLVIGKGNSAFEVAHCALDTARLVHLASPSSAKLAWITKHSGHVRTQYAPLIDTYQLKLLNGFLDCHLTRIRREGDRYVVDVVYTHADGEYDEIEYDRVVRCTGFAFDSGIFGPGCVPETTVEGRLPAMTGCWESVNVPRLFFAGTLMQAIDYQRSSSAFIHGFRYNIRTLARALREREEAGGEATLVTEVLSAQPDLIADRVLHRVSRASSLWSQFSFLCDAMTVDRRSGLVTYHEDVPLRWASERFRDQECWYTVNYEWGKLVGSSFSLARHPTHERSADSQFLHPVVRQWSRADLAAEHHILEDLLGVYLGHLESGMIRSHSGRHIARYHEEEHVQPMRRFFASAGWAGARSEGSAHRPPVDVRTDETPRELRGPCASGTTT